MDFSWRFDLLEAALPAALAAPSSPFPQKRWRCGLPAVGAARRSAPKQAECKHRRHGIAVVAGAWAGAINTVMPDLLLLPWPMCCRTTRRLKADIRGQIRTSYGRKGGRQSWRHLRARRNGPAGRLQQGAIRREEPAALLLLQIQARPQPPDSAWRRHPACAAPADAPQHGPARATVCP